MTLHKTLGALSTTITALGDDLAEVHAENVELTMELGIAHAEIQSLRSKMANPPPAIATTLAGRSKAVVVGPQGKRTLRKPISARTEDEDKELTEAELPALPSGYRFLTKLEGATFNSDYCWKGGWSVIADDADDKIEIRISSPIGVNWMTEDNDAHAIASDTRSNTGLAWLTYSDIPKWKVGGGGWDGDNISTTNSQIYFDREPEDCLVANPAYWDYNGHIH